jgi:hypothetical protein
MRYRIRPLDSSRPSLKIYLLTGLPLRVLPPTEVPIMLAELEEMATGSDYLGRWGWVDAG